MRQSRLLIPTMREIPAEAEMVSHQLLLRAGMIRPVVSGVYNFLPLGYRVLRKVEAIVREEMDRSGAQEVLLTAIQPGELWRQSGRWDTYGPELIRFADRHDRDMVLGPTHEEVITALVRDEVSTYRKLPLILYQIQTKFRDERRPRSGLLRGREFLMKDAYSFDVDEEGLERSYRLMYEAYVRIFKRLKLNFRAVEADSGAIGGTDTHEFMVLSSSGEDTIAVCTRCDYAANIEKAEIKGTPPQGEVEQQPEMELVDTPGKESIADVAAFLQVPVEKTIKSVMLLADDKPVLVLVRGDHEVNEAKVKNHLGASVVEMMDEERCKELGIIPGYAGPVGLQDQVTILADYAVGRVEAAITGANQVDKHWKNAVCGRDYQVHAWGDFRNMTEGDPCPRCGADISFARGIEVGHVFKLGTRYSESMGATYLDESGQRKPMIMGCYGIGVSRLVAAVVEQCHDDKGIIWPLSIAPFQVHLVPVNLENEEQRVVAEELYHHLTQQGIEVLFDDRPERVGVKLNDADLIGIPLRILVGKKAAERVVECKFRHAQEVQERTVDALKEEISNLIAQLS